MLLHLNVRKGAKVGLIEVSLVDFFQHMSQFQHTAGPFFRIVFETLRKNG